MPVSGLHRRVAEVALNVAARHGFALGGGNALIEHGVVDRVTEDVDLFTDDERGVAAAADAVDAALRAVGFKTVRRDKSGGLSDIFPGIGDELAEWIVTGTGGERTMLQLAYFNRQLPPVTRELGPVLALEDVLGGKVCALASRVEPRDYIDTAAALGLHSVAQLIGFARQLDPGLTDREFADAGLQLDTMPDSAFTAYGLTRPDIVNLRHRFADWPRE